MNSLEFILLCLAAIAMGTATVVQYKNKFNAPILIVSYLVYTIFLILKIDGTHTGDWMKVANRVLNIGMGIGWLQFLWRNKHFYKFSDTTTATIIYSPDGSIKWANAQACVMFGMHKRDMIGGSMNDLIMPVDDKIFIDKQARSKKELEDSGASVFVYNWYLDRKTNKTFKATRLLKCEKVDGKVVSITAEIIR